MRDREDHHLLSPNHVGDVVLTKARVEINPPNRFAAEVEEKRVFTDGVTMPKVAKFKRDHQLMNEAVKSDRAPFNALWQEGIES